MTAKNKLKQLIEKKGISQKELAEKVGNAEKEAFSAYASCAEGCPNSRRSASPSGEERERG